MSEYYSERRTQIADFSALAGMGVAALVTSLLNLKVLATGFKTGNLEPALLRFGLLVAGGALVGGGLGMLAGRWGGARWERRHRAHRPATPDDEPTTRQAASSPVAPRYDVRPLSIEAQRAMALRDGDTTRWVGLWVDERLVGMAPLTDRGSVDAQRLVIDPSADADDVKRRLTGPP